MITIGDVVITSRFSKAGAKSALGSTMLPTAPMLVGGMPPFSRNHRVATTLDIFF